MLLAIHHYQMNTKNKMNNAVFKFYIFLVFPNNIMERCFNTHVLQYFMLFFSFIKIIKKYKFWIGKFFCSFFASMRFKIDLVVYGEYDSLAKCVLTFSLICLKKILGVFLINCWFLDSGNLWRYFREYKLGFYCCNGFQLVEG